MTRLEETLAAAKEMLPYPCPIWYLGDSDGYDDAEKETDNRRKIFQVAVEWADEHPRKGLWDSKKVCEWLENKLPIYIDYCHRGVGENSCEFINDLRKAMGD